ncbi:aminocarboxymuconate-semialdehyde decarboxylase [Raineyella antarctica]|uniref:Aminocarboxymuconate-semialdehyde decarboxylase n=1 Tax=Raineyella antarctica TaxID=1577474 RepID=A0A1G6GCT3_9ACTN|nr:amidohydrolase family protein [Raineyella antarctica]SDB79798.1 aminocarboxymuconate-semialdehyde decarboxylase [Raineyella antarctica]
MSTYASQEPSDRPNRVIDVHAHAMPMPFLEWLEDEGLADLSRVRDELVVLDPRISGVPAGMALPLPVTMWGGTERLVEMQESGVEVQAVSLPPFLMASTCRDGALVAEVVRRGNDALAEYVRQAPDYLVALGGVPVGWPGAEQEAVRCLDELGMAGIAIGSQGGGADLDADVNEPLWELLSHRRVFTFLHPSGSPAPERTQDFWFPQLVGYPLETALAASRLVFAGVTERHPFPLCLAHGGGCLPALRARLAVGWERKPQARTIPHPPATYLDRLYYDTAVFDPEQLRRLVQDVGVGQVLTGTDYPFDLADRDPVGTVGSVLDGAEREQVLGGTSAGLLGLADRPLTAG